MVDEITELISDIDSDRQEKVTKMFTDLWDRFSTAPASTKYHGSYVGGLLEHTLEVTNTALWLYNSYRKRLTFTIESLIFCALVHDIGKIGTRTDDIYLNVSTSEIPKFEYNKKALKMDHELLTLFWLNLYGIQITESEMLAIYYHAGPYVESYKKVSETDLLIILHTADNLSAKIMKK